MGTGGQHRIEANRAKETARPGGWCAAPTLLVLLWAAPAPAQDAEVDKLVARLASRDVAVRRTAAGKLSELGVEARTAVPALAQALTDEDRAVRFFAAEALEAALPDQRKQLATVCAAIDDVHRLQGREREQAIRKLGRPGPAGQVAVPQLLAVLNEPGLPLRTQYVVLRALARVDQVDESAAARLAGLLARDDLTVAALAAVSLSRTQAQPEKAIGVLKRHIGRTALFLDDATVLAALERYGKHPAAVDAMAAYLFSDDSNLGYQAALSLSRLRAKEQVAVPVLMRELERGVFDYESTLKALLRYGPLPKSTVELLQRRALLHPDRKDLRAALKHVVPDVAAKVDPGTPAFGALGDGARDFARLARPTQPLRFPLPAADLPRGLLTRKQLQAAIENISFDMESNAPLSRKQGIAGAESLVKSQGWTLLDLLRESVAGDQPASVRLSALGGWEALAGGRRPVARQLATLVFEQALRDKDLAIRIRACEATIHSLAARPKDVELLALLKQAQKDPDNVVRQMAVRALEMHALIQPPGK